MVTLVVGLVLAFAGVALGVLNHQPLGGMVGLLVGIAMVVVAFLLKDDR